MIRTIVTALVTTALGLGVASVVISPAEAASKTYKNCTALNKDYAHGVGKSGARDRTKSRPVTNFKVSTSIYNKNSKSDRDNDGIACEKR